MGISGRLEIKKNSITEAMIPRDRLKAMLFQGGFSDVELILNQWRNKGILDADEGKFTKKRKIFDKGPSIRVIIIRMNIEI